MTLPRELALQNAAMSAQHLMKAMIAHAASPASIAVTG
jgi:hypothetical protein